MHHEKGAGETLTSTVLTETTYHTNESLKVDAYLQTDRCLSKKQKGMNLGLGCVPHFQP